jgi:hypothetical protein
MPVCGVRLENRSAFSSSVVICARSKAFKGKLYAGIRTSSYNPELFILQTCGYNSPMFLQLTNNSGTESIILSDMPLVAKSGAASIYLDGLQEQRYEVDDLTAGDFEARYGSGAWVDDLQLDGGTLPDPDPDPVRASSQGLQHLE